MKAAVWHGGKDIRIEEVPKPEIKDDEVLIRVRAAGICGSEVHAYAGESKRRTPPLIMGHEFTGEITEVGKKGEGVHIGDRVVVDPIIRCETCEQCVIGRSNICKNMRLLGLHRPGAFAEYVAVPSKNCIRLIDSVSFEEGALVEPLSVGVHAVSRIPIKLGDTVVVIGSGIIGLMAAQAAKLAGTAKLFISGGGTREYRLKLSRELGADIVINSKKEDLVRKIMELTNMKGVDAVLEAVGIQTTVQQAMRIVKKGGSVAVIGMLVPKVELEILDAVVKETEIKGIYGYTRTDFRVAVDLISAGRANVKSLITHRFSLDDTREAFEILHEKTEGVVKVLIKP